MRQAAELDFTDIRLVATAADGRDGETPAPGSAFRIYESLDRRLSRARPDPFAEVELEAAIQSPNGSPAVVRDGDPSAAELLAALREARVDVVLDFSGHPARETLARASRCSVWSLHPGDSRRYPADPPLFWELHGRDPVAVTELHATCAEQPEGVRRILYRSYAATDATSLARTRAAVYQKAAHLVARRLRDLHREGWDELLARSELEPATDYDRGVSSPPSAPTMLRHLARIGRRAARRWVGTKIFTGQWFIAVREQDASGRPLEGPANFEPIDPPRGRFFADPFLLEHDGRRCVLFEDYELERGKAVISYVELDEDGRVSAPKLALEREYHLSYPFLFTSEDEAYMIPETGAAGTVELYRARRFPDEWVRERVLISGITAFDSTLLFHDRRFWLFAVVPVEGGSPWDELSLFWSESLGGTWTPHPLNPIVSDARRARPAGRIFELDGALVRPGQDCTGRYGRAIVLNRIETLTTDEYRERPIGTIEPSWAPNIGGTHCYDRGGNYEVVDGCRRVTRWGRTSGHAR